MKSDQALPHLLQHHERFGVDEQGLSWVGFDDHRLAYGEQMLESNRR